MSTNYFVMLYGAHPNSRQQEPTWKCLVEMINVMEFRKLTDGDRLAGCFFPFSSSGSVPWLYQISDDWQWHCGTNTLYDCELFWFWSHFGSVQNMYVFNYNISYFANSKNACQKCFIPKGYITDKMSNVYQPGRRINRWTDVYSTVRQNVVLRFVIDSLCMRFSLFFFVFWLDPN